MIKIALKKKIRVKTMANRGWKKKLILKRINLEFKNKRKKTREKEMKMRIVRIVKIVRRTKRKWCLQGQESSKKVRESRMTTRSKTYSQAS